MDKNLIIAQKKMTNMLSVFHNLCCKYNLTYWCSEGTLVGAIRHFGWVPWDGDLNVNILETDFNILQTYLENELPSTMYYFWSNNNSLVKIKDLYSVYKNELDDKNHCGLELNIFLCREHFVDNIKYLTRIFREDKYLYNDIYPVKLTKFENIEVFVPNNIEKICINLYGGFPPPLPLIENQICNRGQIEPNNPAPYYPIVFKDLYHKKTQQWFSEKANINGISLYQMSGWSYLTEEDWNDLCYHVLQDICLNTITNLLDAGCGVGAYLDFIKKNNNKIDLFACDINENAINKCKQLFPESQIILNSITNLNIYQTNFFDFIVVISTISYLFSLDEVESTVNELLRITKPGGQISICVLTDNYDTLKSFSIIIPKSFWSRFNVSSIKIIDIPVKVINGRYSVFLKK